MSAFEIGTLYAHWRHGQVFMLLSDDRFTVTMQNLTDGKEFIVPVDQFTRWWSPMRGAHE